MLSNAYFLAKIRFDTVENEPAKNLQKFAKFLNAAGPRGLLLRGRGLVTPSLNVLNGRFLPRLASVHASHRYEDGKGHRDGRDDGLRFCPVRLVFLRKSVLEASPR